MKEITLTRGKVALVDDSDYEWLSQRKWHAQMRGGGLFYAVRFEGRALVSMHRFIINAPADKLVDHANGDTLDNTRQNLRLATYRENCRNRRMQRNNTSGFRGVHWDKNAGKWRAKIKVDGVERNIGLFTDPVEAAKSYNEAALHHHGEFARINKIG